MPPRPLPTLDQLLAARCRRALSDMRRRAKKDGQALDYDAADLAALVRESGGLCAYCRHPLHPELLSFDHARPLAQGGAWSLRNLDCCCRACNVRKGAMSAAEFRQLLALLATFHPAAQADVRSRLLHGTKVYMRGRKK